MGKKGGWISALKKAFTSKSKEKFDTGPGNYVKEKQELGRKRHGEVNSFIPLYREPSSIEKILSDVEKEQQYKADQMSYKKVQHPKSPIPRQNTGANISQNVVSDKANTSDKKTTVAPCKAKSIISSKQTIIRNNISITSNHVHISATKIQAAYRGYMLLTITPKTAHAAHTDARSGGAPVWWNWLDRQNPSVSHHANTPAPQTPRPSSAATTAGAAHHRSSMCSKQPKTPFDGSTPRLSRSLHTHNSSNRWQAVQLRPALRDDHSLASCPAFTAQLVASVTSAAAVPNYMAPTVSAKAKVRATAMDSGGGAKEGKRFSFALSQSIGSLRLFSAMKKAAPVVPTEKKTGGRHRSILSVGELSVESTVSLPAGLGKRPFK